MKTLFLITFTLISTQAYARCKPGDLATVIWAGDRDSKGYKFSSYTTGSQRVLPVGTRLMVVNAQYITMSGVTFLSELDAQVSGPTRTMFDTQTNEAFSCEPLQKENGRFIPSQAGYFGMDFVSCQQRW